MPLTLEELERSYQESIAGPPVEEPEKEPFNPDGTGYDYDTATEAGIVPDQTGHWPSLDPRTGMLLKGAQHPSISLTLDEEDRLGNVMTMKDGRYYSIKRPGPPKPDMKALEADYQESHTQKKLNDPLGSVMDEINQITRGLEKEGIDSLDATTPDDSFLDKTTDFLKESGKAIADVPRQAFKGAAAGSAMVGETFGSVMQFTGERLKGSKVLQTFDVINDKIYGRDVPDVGATVAEAGKQIADYFQKEREAWAIDKDLNGSIWENPKLLADTSWITYNVFQMAPTLLGAMLPGAAAAKTIQIGGKAIQMSPVVIARLARIGAAVTGGSSAGVMEGSHTYREVLQRTGNERQAASSGTMMAAAAAALNSLGFLGILSKGKGVLKHTIAGVGESVTEASEEPAESLAIDLAEYFETGEMKPGVWKRMVTAMRDQGLNVAVPAFILGTGMSTQTKKVIKDGENEILGIEIGEEAGEEGPTETPPPAAPPVAETQIPKVAPKEEAEFGEWQAQEGTSVLKKELTSRFDEGTDDAGTAIYTFHKQPDGGIRMGLQYKYDDGEESRRSFLSTDFDWEPEGSTKEMLFVEDEEKAIKYIEELDDVDLTGKGEPPIPTIDPGLRGGPSVELQPIGKVTPVGKSQLGSSLEQDETGQRFVEKGGVKLAAPTKKDNIPFTPVQLLANNLTEFLTQDEIDSLPAQRKPLLVAEEDHREGDIFESEDRRAEILGVLYEGLTPVPKPVVFQAGGPTGAGKGTITDRLDLKNTLKNDPDKIKVIGGHGGETAPDYHEESSYLSKVAMRRALDEGYNVLFDTRMNNFEKADTITREALEEGKEVVFIFADIDLETSMVRALARALSQKADGKQPRIVPEDAIVEGYNQSLPTFVELYEKYKDNKLVTFHLIDNGVDGRDPVWIIEENEVLDQEKLDSMLNIERELIRGRYEQTDENRGTIFRLSSNSESITDRVDTLLTKKGHQGLRDQGLSYTGTGLEDLKALIQSYKGEKAAAEEVIEEAAQPGAAPEEEARGPPEEMTEEQRRAEMVERSPIVTALRAGGFDAGRAREYIEKEGGPLWQYDLAVLRQTITNQGVDLEKHHTSDIAQALRHIALESVAKPPTTKKPPPGPPPAAPAATKVRKTKPRKKVTPLKKIEVETRGKRAATGEEVTIKTDAETALRDIDEQLDEYQQLKECLES